MDEGIEAVKNFPAPRNKFEVQRFIWIMCLLQKIYGRFLNHRKTAVSTDEKG